MNTPIRYIITSPRLGPSPFAINWIEPVSVWDFDGGLFPSGFVISRAASAFGYDGAGRFISYSAGLLRYDARRLLRTAVIEPAATNLLSRAIASTTIGWTLSGASGSNLALNALGLFPGVTVTSNGAIWHRLNHTDEPAVTNGASYHLRTFFKFGTSGKIVATLRNMTGAVESRVEVSTTTNTVLGAGAGGLDSITLTDLGVDGAYRLGMNITPNFTGTLNIGLGPGSATTGATVTLLGAQFESGTTGSSLINTTGATSTRPADAVTWAAPVGTYDLRIVDGAGAAIDSRSVSVSSGWAPQALPFYPARVLLYPVGTL